MNRKFIRLLINFNKNICVHHLMSIITYTMRGIKFTYRNFI